jgi:putative membrane protein
VPAAPTRRLGRRALLLAALTSGQLGVILPVLAGASQVVDDLFRDEGGAILDLLPSSTAGVALGVAGLLALAWSLSVAGTLVAFAGFEVRREGERLRIRRGFLQTREATIPVPRVHAVRVVEGVLRQPLGLALVRVEVAGYAREASAAQTLFPVLHVREVRALLDELLPELADAIGALEGPPARAARRYAALPGAGGLALGAGVAAFTPAGPAALLIALPAALWGWSRHRAAGWRLEPDRLVLRFRRLARTTVVIARGRLQERTLSQTLLQRRAALAGLEVAVASGASFGVAHLDATTAGGLLAALGPRHSTS